MAMSTLQPTNAVRKAALGLLSFLNASPTPYHAAMEASVRLEKAGFCRLREEEEWDISPGGRYYFTSLRVRPVSKKTANGYLQVAVETYGGGIWHTWFDRDLGLAGRVIVTAPSSSSSSSSGGPFHSKLVKINKPLLRIPSLAIHLDRSVNENFKFNQETEFMPVLGLSIASQLNNPIVAAQKETGEQQADQPENKTKKNGGNGLDIAPNHHPAILHLLAEELSVKPEEIHDFELHLFDTQPPCLGGINEEFIFSPRLDNQMTSYCALEALIESVSDESQATIDSQTNSNVNLIALFNHEEVGSVSTTGAESSLIPSVMSRLSPTPDALARTIARSFLISSDMGHGIHPNYTSKYQQNHRPELNGGIVLKTNAKQKYTTDAVGSFFIKQLAARRNGSVQEFEVRNDMTCGSTVGPLLSKLGVRTVDVGLAQL
ncbi:hypothetical protein FRC17_008780, partial [Serendipita sp. 399]